jgi:hypothetical protein
MRHYASHALIWTEAEIGLATEHAILAGVWLGSRGEMGQSMRRFLAFIYVVTPAADGAEATVSDVTQLV